MIKKLYAVNYIVLRALIIIGVLAAFLGVLPADPVSGKKVTHLVVAGVSLAIGIGLVFVGRAVKKKGLDDGLAPDVFTPHGAQKIMSYFWLVVMNAIIILPF